ncbi:GntR family transcriptional regulator [Streptomyces hirsutus]
MSLLRRENVEMSEAEQTLSARLADVEVADRLNIGLGAAVLFAERVLRSPSGPLDCLHSWYRGDLYRWQARLAVEPAGR